VDKCRIQNEIKEIKKKSDGWRRARFSRFRVLSMYVVVTHRLTGLTLDSTHFIYYIADLASAKVS
jgi:hypothetical protein